MADATFEEGRERPLRLIARDTDDLHVISALVQDAVLTGADLRFDARRRRFALLLNRFRWEDRARAVAGGRPERVRAVLEVSDVQAARHQGLAECDGETVLALLALTWTPAASASATAGSATASSATAGAAAAGAAAEAGLPAGPGRVTLIFSGDGAVALDVECLEVRLCDVTRPYLAPSRRVPQHECD